MSVSTRVLARLCRGRSRRRWSTFGSPPGARRASPSTSTRAVAWLDGHLRALCAEGVAIVVGLDAGAQAAGFVTIDPRTGYLDQLCVAPAERGSGLALALLDEAKRRAPGYVELEVNEANARALRFYRREGFAAVARGLSALSGLPTLRMRWPASG